ncbi:MAG: putative Hybrid histidine kinase, partial [Acidimicrobiales bacterium]|nr:putative Hybrid histidine kinase [Acidimicrobiales bacterium]
TICVLYAVWVGNTARSELIEIPLLSGILAIVVIGAQRRERAMNDIQAAKDRMEALAHDERLELQTRLDRLQQLEALGRMSLGIAHDLNNVVTALLGGSEELVEQLDGRSAQDTAREMLDAANRTRGLMDELVGYARESDLQLGSSDLNDVANEMERMLRRLIPQDIHLELDLQAPNAVIAADRGRVGQVLVNLVVNAADAVDGRGRIRIATHEAHRTSNAEHGHSTPIVVLAIEDTGRGIPPDILQKVFEPGFTTKGGGRNLGMGMASVQRIVDLAGGIVDIQSSAGRGTTIRMEFPVVPRNAAVEAIGATAPVALIGTESVLVAEDDRHVRRRTVTILRGAGYKVFATEDGDEALTGLTSETSVQLLLTDVSMPGLSGPDVVRAVRRRLPELPVLFMSGRLGDFGLEEFAQPVSSLRKPFSSGELLTAVRSLLDQPHGQPPINNRPGP